MIVIIGFFAGLLGAIAGFFAGLGAGLLLVEVFHISSFEGQSGYFVVFVAGMGCIVGFIAGVLLSVILYRRGMRNAPHRSISRPDRTDSRPIP